MQQVQRDSVRLAVDIGGTFTDSVVLTARGTFTSKVLTTPHAPEVGALEGIRVVLDRAGLAPADVSVFVHGTTIATNTVIERKGAKTALITTAGFRDVLDIGYESRHDQYNLQIDKIRPLVPRELRVTVCERIDAGGSIRVPLDANEVEKIVAGLLEQGVEGVAVAYLHSYRNVCHEQLTREIIKRISPELSVTLSAEVCPEIREYERFTTAVVNAYVQPAMSGYLTKLRQQVKSIGLTAPMFLMTSGGGLTDIETAIRYPVRLLESGPAGGVLLACQIASDCDVQDAVSFDMGGTTAKFAMITDQKPVTARTFEVDRQDRYLKGSGMPIRIPAIELVEIGAGGGSIARIDHLRRIAIGPDSAAADPGPVSYGRGGTLPTVTDADVVQGRIDPTRFAGGQIALDVEKATKALSRDIGEPLGMNATEAAFSVSEIVDEMMSNAGRKHAIERGKDLSALTMIAFGGAAPLHACRLAQKMGISQVIIPKGAGVGSALGFLAAPIGFEVVRTQTLILDIMNFETVNEFLADMRREAAAIVEDSVEGAAQLKVRRSTLMRYVGQGHEISVDLPEHDLTSSDLPIIRAEFERLYALVNAQTIRGGQIEILSWSVFVTAARDTATPQIAHLVHDVPAKIGEQFGFDPVSFQRVKLDVYWRDNLQVGDTFSGPAIVAEDETSTFVDSGFNFSVLPNGCLVLLARTSNGGGNECLS